MEKVDYIQDVKSEICLFTMEGDTHLINNLLKNSSWTTLSVSGKKDQDKWDCFVLFRKYMNCSDAHCF